MSSAGEHPPDLPDAFGLTQRLYFEEPNAPRFHWQTTQPYVAERERELLPDARGARPTLEVGCGEGPNLYHFMRHGGGGDTRWVAADLFHKKVRFAARQVPGTMAVCARAQRLPFRDGTFRHVLSRDLLHHVLDMEVLVAEVRRVCAPGGTITLIEANGRNPIIWLFGLLKKAERQVMKMNPAVLARVARPPASDPAADLAVEFFEPLPIYRILFHYRFGLPGLARSAWCRRAVAGIERLAGRFLPRERWAYIRVTLRLPGGKNTTARLP